MAAELPSDTFDLIHAGLASKVGPLFQAPPGADDDLSNL